MTELTIVTAFFDIGRGNFAKQPRSNTRYLNDFRFWARLQNQLIVYTDASTAESILDVRRCFGLEHRTRVVVINDIFSIDRELFCEMKKVADSPWFLEFRLIRDAMSNIPEYSYLMLLKTWFIADAVDRGYAGEVVAWLDLGFNRGGSLYTHAEDFDYLWEFEFADRVHVFHLDREEPRPVFEMVRTSADYAMGAPLIVPSSLAGRLWQLNRSCMLALTQIGLIDDDQLIQLMSARLCPDLFEFHASDWFLPLKQFGGEHLRIEARTGDSRWRAREALARLVRGMRIRRRAFSSAVRLYRNSVDR